MKALLILALFAGAALAQAPQANDNALDHVVRPLPTGQGVHPNAVGPKHRKLLGFDGTALAGPNYVNSTGARAGLCTVLPGILDPNDGTTAITSTSQFNPTGTGGALTLPVYPTIWDATSGLYIGDLVVDNKVCKNALSDNPVIGGSAQDYVTATYANWETYGWQQFKTGKAATQNYGKIIVTTLQLWLVGTRATGSTSTCTATDVSVAIFADSAGSPSGSALKSSTPSLGTVNNFKWAGNVSSVVITDVADLSNPWLLDESTTYWLRIKVKATYTSTDRCFVYWATTSSTSHNLPATWALGRWQESVGGAGGYSTNCVGAKLDALNAAAGSLPGADQSLYACFNGGIKTTGVVSTRRCLSYKNQFTPALSCAAGLNQYVFALLGDQGLAIPGGDTST